MSQLLFKIPSKRLFKMVYNKGSYRWKLFELNLCSFSYNQNNIDTYQNIREKLKKYEKCESKFTTNCYIHILQVNQITWNLRNLNYVIDNQSINQQMLFTWELTQERNLTDVVCVQVKLHNLFKIYITITDKIIKFIISTEYQLFWHWFNFLMHRTFLLKPQIFIWYNDHIYNNNQIYHFFGHLE